MRLLQLKSLVGQQFGKLKILEYHSTDKKAGRLWKAGCWCGNYKLVSTSDLMRSSNRALRSCGSCDFKNKFKKEHEAWAGAQQRCYNRNHASYKNYGGRGINMCLEWRLDFTEFLLHIGMAPGPEYSLDRINTNGNYEPNNVRWSTRIEQIINRNYTLPITKALYKAKLSGEDPF